MAPSMTAFQQDDRVVEFTARLSAYARRNYQPGQVSHADLMKAFSHGWTPRHLAEQCSRDLPSSRAWEAIQRRLRWHATNPPTTTESRPVIKPHDCTEHSDGHVCPWINLPSGRVERCSCAGRPA